MSFSLNELYLISLVFILNFSCTKEEFYSEPDKLLVFSVDTLSFDTVFTSLASATKSIKIFNPHDRFIKITTAKLENGSNSKFRINIDGTAGELFQDIIIRPRDSIYVFVEVTVDPDAPLIESPFIITDALVLTVNGVEQKLVLLAWGQNANYFPSKSNKSQIGYIDLQGQVMIWDDPKPYIIYGIVYVDNGDLIIPEGTQIYVSGGITKGVDAEGNSFFYNDGRIIIGPNARIIVNGSIDKPVIFQGVRLEEAFRNIPGQWSGIVLDKSSHGNSFTHCTIKNNLLGIYLDSLSEAVFHYCKIYNNSLHGIYAFASNVKADNCLFYNQGQQSFIGVLGGKYEFNFCSFANVGNNESGVVVRNNVCLDPPFCQQVISSDLQAKWTNCIISGSDKDEFWQIKDSDQRKMFDVQLEHCILRVSDLIKPENYPDFISTQTNKCIISNNLEKLFKDISNDDFHLDTLSIAEGKAIPLMGFEKDLDGKLRDALTPDIGCYEYIK
ncbi:MAG: right-handed parallel beta-helix repeat-containing protein [Bacteroidota bacterium]|nr:right-handed parallel beta-helix repeat-containing protein [Bacteroidota bacterium]